MNSLRSETQALVVILCNKKYTGHVHQPALASGCLQTAAITLRNLLSDSQQNQLCHNRSVTNMPGLRKYSGRHKESE